MRNNMTYLLLSISMLTGLTACGSSGSSAEATTEYKTASASQVVSSVRYQHLDAEDKVDYDGTDTFTYKEENGQFIYSFESGDREYTTDETKVFDAEGRLLSCDEKEMDMICHWDFTYDSDGNLTQSIMSRKESGAETYDENSNKVTIYTENNDGTTQKIIYDYAEKDLKKWDSREEIITDQKGNCLSDKNYLWDESNQDGEMTMEITASYDSYGQLASQTYKNEEEQYETLITTKEEGDTITYSVKDLQWDITSENTYRIEEGKLYPLHLLSTSPEGKKIDEYRYDDNGNLIYAFNDAENSDSEFTYLFGGRRDDYLAHFQSRTENGKTAEANCYYDDAGNRIKTEVTNYDQTKIVYSYAYEGDCLKEVKQENYAVDGKKVDTIIKSFDYVEAELPQAMLEELKEPYTNNASFRTASDLRQEETTFVWEDVVNYYLYQ